MSTQVEGTSASGYGDNDFVEWLRSHGVKSSMIQTLINDISSVDELKHIKNDEIDLIANDMNLKTLEKNKLRYIIEKAKSQSVNIWNVISSEEQLALIQMKQKIADIEESMQHIGKIEKDIDDQLTDWMKDIEFVFVDINKALNKRKNELIKKLNVIANEYKNELNNKNKQLNEKYCKCKKTLENCHNYLSKSIEIQEMEARKDKVLSLAKYANNDNDINIIINNRYKINVSLNKNTLTQIVNTFGHISKEEIPKPILLSINENEENEEKEMKLVQNNKISKKQMQFDNRKYGHNLQFIHGNIVKKVNKNGWVTCLFGDEINNKMCNQFTIWVKCKVGSPCFMMGYITASIRDSVKNWNGYLGLRANSQNCVAYDVNYGYNYFVECCKGSLNNLSFRAANNFKEGDIFKLSFNFEKNELIISYNKTKAETRPLLDNCKKFTFAICIGKQNDEIEITNYEFL